MGDAMARYSLTMLPAFRIKLMPWFSAPREKVADKLNLKPEKTITGMFEVFLNYVSGDNNCLNSPKA